MLLLRSNFKWTIRTAFLTMLILKTLVLLCLNIFTVTLMLSPQRLSAIPTPFFQTETSSTIHPTTHNCPRLSYLAVSNGSGKKKTYSATVELEKDNEAEEMIPLPEGYRTRRILKAAAANGMIWGMKNPVWGTNKYVFWVECANLSAWITCIKGKREGGCSFSAGYGYLCDHCPVKRMTQNENQPCQIPSKTGDGNYTLCDAKAVPVIEWQQAD